MDANINEASMAQSGPCNLELEKCTWLYSGVEIECILHDHWLIPAGAATL
jgi:hypothetical protein